MRENRIVISKVVELKVNSLSVRRLQLVRVLVHLIKIIFKKPNGRK